MSTTIERNDTRLDDLTVATDDVRGGASVPPPQTEELDLYAGGGRDGYRAGSCRNGVSAEERNGRVQWRVRAGDRSSQGRVDRP